jgi:glycosyltransferase involved in cell wall biosynthesis
MKISVVIATYRRSVSLRRTLATIAAQLRQPEEVIVVDQSPAGERTAVSSAIEAAAAKKLNIRVIWSETPSSTHARNLGLAAASGEWVVFSDDDVDWPPSVTGDFIAKIESSPDLVMVAACDRLTSFQTRPVWRRALSAAFFTNTLWPLRRGKVLTCMQARYPQPVVGDMETEWATGYWFAVDRNFVVSHQLTFDEKMSRYAQAEDMLFTYQVYLAAMRAGRRAIVSEGITVDHLISQEWREPDSFADLCGAWNRIYIASVLRTGISFWISLAAIYWAAIHQVLVRMIRGRGWVGHLRAYAIAVRYLGEIRAGRFEKLYALYEKPRPMSHE